MSFESLQIEFALASSLSSENIEQLLQHLIDTGCTTDKEGGTDHCRYASKSTGYRTRSSTTADAIREIANDKHGRISMFYGEYDEGKLSSLGLSIRIYPNSTPGVVIAVDAVHFKSDSWSTETIEGKVSDLLFLTKEVYAVLQPVHVVGRKEFEIAVESPLSSLTVHGLTIEHPIDWMAIFSPETVDRLGTAWIDDVDLWNHERLADGALLVVLTPRPDMHGEIGNRLETLADRSVF